MDTLIFTLLAVTFFLVLRKNSPAITLSWWAGCLALTIILFAIHVSDPLDLSF